MTISRSLVLLACGLGLATIVIGCTKQPGATDLRVAAPVAGPQAAAPPAPPTPDEFMAQAALARFITISYGEERAVCAEREQTCWSRNRRVHLLVKAQ